MSVYTKMFGYVCISALLSVCLLEAQRESVPYYSFTSLTRTSAGCFGASRHFERLPYRPLCISGRYWLCDSFVTNSHLYHLRLRPSHLHRDTLSPQVSLRPAPGLRCSIPEAFCV